MHLNTGAQIFLHISPIEKQLQRPRNTPPYLCKVTCARDYPARISSLRISVSQSACRQYMTGARPKISKILGTCMQQCHAVIWCHVHAGLEGSERAEGRARRIGNRAPIETTNHQSPRVTSWRPKERYKIQLATPQTRY